MDEVKRDVRELKHRIGFIIKLINTNERELMGTVKKIDQNKVPVLKELMRSSSGNLERILAVLEDLKMLDNDETSDREKRRK